MYDSIMTAPMLEELTSLGIRSLQDPAEVDATLGETAGTVLVVVNSVCGCAAANARPGVRQALDHATRPDQVVTVFAGVDAAATERARSYFQGYMPSSPSMALLRDGQCVFMLQRHEIESREPGQIASVLTRAFDEHCA